MRGVHCQGMTDLLKAVRCVARLSLASMLLGLAFKLPTWRSQGG